MIFINGFRKNRGRISAPVLLRTRHRGLSPLSYPRTALAIETSTLLYGISIAWKAW